MYVLYLYKQENLQMERPGFTIHNLLSDPAFIRWVKNPYSENGKIWEDWGMASTSNKACLEEAKRIVLELAYDNDEPFEEEMVELWKRIQYSNSISDQRRLKRPHFFQEKVHWQYLAAAASFVVICFISWFFILNRPSKEQHTAYGKTQRLVLPDRSVVILNGNSTIRYSDSWKGKDREVWLEGEAFFVVQHKRNFQKFVVHTPDLDVQVTGTKFNVNTYHQRTRVVLNSGKVKLLLDKMTIEMEPGDLVDFSSTTKRIEKKLVNAPRYSSWIKDKFVFEDTPLAEIARILQDNYGYQVTFKDSSLSKLTFTGTLDSKNTDLLFLILEKSFGLDIRKNGKHITINN